MKWVRNSELNYKEEKEMEGNKLLEQYKAAVKMLREKREYEEVEVVGEFGIVQIMRKKEQKNAVV